MTPSELVWKTQGVARGVEAEALEDGLLPVERKVGDEFGGQRDLVGASDDEPGAAFEMDVHLTLAGMADLDFDEQGVGDRPWFA